MTARVADRGGRRAFADGSSSRLPAPTRHRRPALAALAVVLIVGGALVSGLIALRIGERTDYVVARRPIEVGHKIEAADLALAQLGGEGANAILATDRAKLVGTYATTRIPERTLLNWQMVSVKEQVPTGAAVVGVVLTAEQRPANPLKVGDIVAVYAVPRLDDAAGEATQIVRAAAVVEVGEARAGSGGGVAVSLLVDEDRVADLTLNAALHKIAVVKLPAATRPDVSPRDAG